MRVYSCTPHFGTAHPVLSPQSKALRPFSYLPGVISYLGWVFSYLPENRIDSLKIRNRWRRFLAPWRGLTWLWCPVLAPHALRKAPVADCEVPNFPGLPRLQTFPRPLQTTYRVSPLACSFTHRVSPLATRASPTFLTFFPLPAMYLRRTLTR